MFLRQGEDKRYEESGRTYEANAPNRRHLTMRPCFVASGLPVTWLKSGKADNEWELTLRVAHDLTHQDRYDSSKVVPDGD